MPKELISRYFSGSYGIFSHGTFPALFLKFELASLVMLFIVAPFDTGDSTEDSLSCTCTVNQSLFAEVWFASTSFLTMSLKNFMQEHKHCFLRSLVLSRGHSFDNQEMTDIT